MSKTIEQYNRIKRWHRLFQEIDSGKNHNQDTHYYVDTVYAFFQNCWHLKDWIKHDDENNLTKQDMDNFTKRHPELKVCGSLCNCTKHLKITGEKNKKFFDKNTEIGDKHLKLGRGGGAPQVKIKFEIVDSKKTYDAFNLATKCLEIWRNFLKDNGFDIDKETESPIKFIESVGVENYKKLVER